MTLDPGVLEWLLEKDDPGPRYLALRDLLRAPQDDPELKAAREAAHRAGPIAAVLDAMLPEGYWVEPGPGYNLDEPVFPARISASSLAAMRCGPFQASRRSMIMGKPLDVPRVPCITQRGVKPG